MKKKAPLLNQKFVLFFFFCFVIFEYKIRFDVGGDIGLSNV